MGWTESEGVICHSLGPAMKQDFPDVENYVRFRDLGRSIYKS